MPQTRRQQIGRWGETVAALYLEKRGYQVLARNVRAGHEEIDLLASHPVDGLVFVEVKTRTNERFGLPEEAVDHRKLDHLYQAAEAYLQNHSEYTGMDWRMDVIAIQGQPGAKVEDVVIEHFENISA